MPVYLKKKKYLVKLEKAAVCLKTKQIQDCEHDYKDFAPNILVGDVILFDIHQIS